MRAIALAILMAGAEIQRAVRGEPKLEKPDGGLIFFLLLFLVCLVMGW
jgi:hypothetical protein